MVNHGGLPGRPAVDRPRFPFRQHAEHGLFGIKGQTAERNCHGDRFCWLANGTAPAIRAGAGLIRGARACLKDGSKFITLFIGGKGREGVARSNRPAAKFGVPCKKAEN